MTAFSLAHLGGGPLSFDPTKVGTDSPAKVEAFNDALARQTAAASPPPAQAQPVPPVPLAGTDGAVPGVQPTRPDEALDGGTAERERVRKALDLEGAAAGATTTGDSILGGISKLRGIFDARQNHITELMRSDMATTQSLMAMQMEIAQYSVMIDVSSKLTGKAASTLDTLMKGQ